MAATPPHQIRLEVSTPPTPLHGIAHGFESPPRRHSERLTQRKAVRDSQSTPESSQLTPRKGRSFGSSPGSRRSSHNSDLGASANPPKASPKHRATRRIQVFSPSSPELESLIPKPTASSHLQPTIFSSTTTMSDGMLPTPIKTPKRKMIPKVNGAARALFQEQPILGEEVAPLRRTKKQRRYNGFSLESFHTDDTTQQGRIQIFTDSRDQVPEPVTLEDNPFAEAPVHVEEPSAKRVAVGTKRRKISGEKSKDPQVEEAINRDEGMVYVFRGKKVYRRFDDMDDEEEVIDTGDLGLLEHVPDGAGRLPMKTLTRKSIKPRRLFQTEQQKKARQAEKEEEAATDIEDEKSPIDLIGASSKAEIEVIDLITPAEPRRTLRSPKKTATKSNVSVVEKVKEHDIKNGSPFASWKRLKSSAGSIAPTGAKGTKRLASEAEEGTSSKRVKAD